MSYEFSNADVCIILSPCGLERFNAMVEDLDPGVREEVLDILGSADIEEAEDRAKAMSCGSCVVRPGARHG